MPVYITHTDGTQTETDEATISLPNGLDVRRIRLRWNEISLFDAEGRESVLISRGTHAGAGMEINFADHLNTS